ncbi:MAG: hypothetical protein HQK83_04075 [Fibrobacteria bacterium]|nr:hypothetical protein [Fibrobacteria bacterium]
MDLCYVSLPEIEGSETLWDNQLKTTLNNAGFDAIKGDDIFSRGSLDTVWENVLNSRIVICDLTGKTPNILYQLGLAHALNKDVIVICQSIKDIPADLQDEEPLIYTNSPAGHAMLEQELNKRIQEMLSQSLYDNFSNPVEGDDYVVLFLGDDGAGSCALANIITRNTIEEKVNETRLVSIAASWNDTTQESLSENVSQVLNEEYGTDFSGHLTIKLDFDLLNRADLIIPLNKALLKEIPSDFMFKAKLFTTLFAGEGDISEIGTEGLEQCREVAKELKTIIQKNSKRLEEMVM